METRSIGIREKIIAGFLVLIIIFGLNGIYNLITINNSQKILWAIMTEKDPSIKSLNHFSANIHKIIDVGSGIINNNINQNFKSDFVEANIDETKKDLIANSLFWEAAEEKQLLNTIMIDVDSLKVSFSKLKIIKKEQTHQADSLASIVYNNKVIPLSLKILENSSILIHAKEIEKDNFKEKLSASFETLKNGIFTLGLLIIVICIVISIYTSYTVLIQINKISKITEELSLGVLPELIENPGNDEVGKMTDAMNKLITGLRQTTFFAKNIGDGAFDTAFTPLSNDDVLGNSLLTMRDNLKKSK